jgi:hypothetical protein
MRAPERWAVKKRSGSGSPSGRTTTSPGSGRRGTNPTVGVAPAASVMVARIPALMWPRSSTSTPSAASAVASS